jgi:multimeric flavodoxin WrbA
MAGNTGQLLAPLLDACEAAGGQVSRFEMDKLKVGPCRACDVCHRTGECATRDDFQKARDAMLAADGIVLASPNYLFSVSAQMKALLDRLCGPLHCQAFRGKHAAAVVTSGGTESRPVEEYLLHFLRIMGCWTVGSVGASAGQIANPSQRPAALADARALGGRLVKAIRARTRYPEQEAEQRAFGERMKALVNMRKDVWKYEAGVWASRRE